MNPFSEYPLTQELNDQCVRPCEWRVEDLRLLPSELVVTRTEYNPWFTKATQTCSPPGMNLKDVGPTVFYEGRNPS